MPDLPPLLKAALQLRAETDLSRLFLPAMPDPTPLSPAAQAVLDAFNAASDGHYINGEWIQDHPGQIAAALRAAADLDIPDELFTMEFGDGWAEAMGLLKAIAAELEAHHA